MPPNEWFRPFWVNSTLAEEGYVRRLAGAGAILALVAGLFAVLPTQRAAGFPTASSDPSYEEFGRVFPDPHGCLRPLGGTELPISPWAKGRVCAVQFLQWNDVLSGLSFLEDRFPRFLRVINLREELRDNPAFAEDELQSAGLPQEDLSRLKRDLYIIKVTDAESSTPEAARKHFAYSLSIHGIERAGIEGGIRAVEDLVTWAACEQDAGAAPSCADEAPFPKRILEPSNSGPTAGEVLREGVVYFVLSNPDGWHRGDLTEGGVFYQRYNGNGMDLNRDWPTIGFTDAQYTPASEPETRGYSKFLRSVRQRASDGRFAGAIDLHGMLSARSFSYTLLGAGQRDYRKNALSVDTSIRTWRDAESRLLWSSLIAPQGECPGEVSVPAFGGGLPMCSDQWGTVWDTINYQVTGSFGDWMDSSLGLDAVGIANEMAFSHLSNCGLGTCYVPEWEQLHIDGNKGLIYSQIASLLEEKPVRFVPGGKVAYVFDSRRIRSAGNAPPVSSIASLPVQEPITGSSLPGSMTFSFDVKGPADGFYNGGLTIKATSGNVRAVSPNAAASFILDYCGTPEHVGDEPGKCVEVARYFNQGSAYVQAGARIDLNDPRPGPYQIRRDDARLAPTDYTVTFNRDAAFPVPRQASYDVSRMDFFRDLNRYAAPGKDLKALTPEAIAADPSVLSGYDSLVLTGEFLPGASRVPASRATAYAAAVRSFAMNGGNVVLLDGAMAGLPGLLPAIKPEHVSGGYFYAGWMDFDDGNGPTYDQALAKGVNKEGSAEGRGTIGGVQYVHRHQTYEPVPIGYVTSSSGSANASCTVDRCDSPNWVVDRDAWQAAGGTTAARTAVRSVPKPATDAQLIVGTSLGEVKLGKGVVRIAGAILPDPTEKNYHPFGLSSYALTYTGYQVFENLIAYRAPAKGSTGDPNVLGKKDRRTTPSTGTGAAPLGFIAIALAAALGVRLRSLRGKQT